MSCIIQNSPLTLETSAARMICWHYLRYRQQFRRLREALKCYCFLQATNPPDLTNLGCFITTIFLFGLKKMLGNIKPHLYFKHNWSYMEIIQNPNHSRHVICSPQWLQQVTNAGWTFQIPMMGRENTDRWSKGMSSCHRDVPVELPSIFSYKLWNPI